MAKKRSLQKETTRQLDDSYRGADGPYELIDLPPRDGFVDIFEVSQRLAEKVKRSGFASFIGSKQPRPSRRHPFLMDYLRKRRRKNGKLTARDVWNELKRHTHDFPLKIRGGEMWHHRGVLKVDSAKHGGDGTFTRKKFVGYFRACETPPTRAK